MQKAAHISGAANISSITLRVKNYLARQYAPPIATNPFYLIPLTLHPKSCSLKPVASGAAIWGFGGTAPRG